MTKLAGLFDSLGIETAHPGFYDSEAFLAAERQDSRFLDNYGRFVSERKYSDEYLERARREIPAIAAVCHEELVADGRLGACIDIGMVLSRILEREGFWNYMIKGSLTVSFPEDSSIGKRFFWSFDITQRGQPGFAAAHAWIVAPPFTVVDVAIRQQPYDRGLQYLPETVLTETIETQMASLEDVFSPPYLAFARANGTPSGEVASTLAPHYLSFAKDFRPTSVRTDKVGLLYIPVAAGAPADPFEKMNIWKCNGRLGLEMYHDLVLPRLRSLRGA